MNRHPFWKQNEFWVLAIIAMMVFTLMFMLWFNYRTVDFRDPVTVLVTGISGLCMWAAKTILTRKTPEDKDKPDE